MHPAAFVFLILAVCLGSLYAGFRGVAWLFAHLSGWHRLERAFPCPDEPPPWTHSPETIQVNAIRFRRCAQAAVCPDAFYLRIASIIRSRPVRIPWNQLSAYEAVMIYRRPAIRFTVAETRIAVEAPLYAAMYPHLTRFA
jgi:hypothetical protein